MQVSRTPWRLGHGHQVVTIDTGHPRCVVVGAGHQRGADDLGQVIVGETTGGGAHPGELRKVDAHVRMFVATGRAISPITKTNWEGTGAPQATPCSPAPGAE